MKSLRFGAVLLISALLLTGCSLGARLLYNNLDWLVQRQVDDYIALDPAQELRLEEDFKRWWHWHRTTQLPAYAVSLRQWAGQLEDGLQRQEIDDALSAFEGFYLAALNQGYADFAALLVSLDENQVRQLEKTLSRDLEDYRKDEVALSDPERRKLRIKRTRKALESRLGRLDQAQKQLIEQWSEEHEDLGQQWYASRKAWLGRFTALLGDRQAPDFAQRLRPLIFDPGSYWEPGHAEAVVRNQLRQLDMLSAVAAQASPRQRQHLRKDLLRLAELCERLAAQTD